LLCRIVFGIVIKKSGMNYSFVPDFLLFIIGVTCCKLKDFLKFKKSFSLVNKNIDNLSQKIIITNDDIDYSTSTVRHIKLKDFLVMTSL